MARTVKDSKLDNRTGRDELKPSGKPYYKAIDSGLHLGYRKGKRSGKWVVRWYKGNGEYQLETIGIADDTQDADGVTVFNYSQAQAHARDLSQKWGMQAQGHDILPDGPYLVEDAMNDYLLDYERRGGKDYIGITSSINAHIIPTLGNTDIAILTQRKLKSWHDDLTKTPARLRTREGQELRYREAPKDEEDIRKRRSSTNRILTILKSALNYAYRESRISTDAAWVNVKPYKNVDAPKVRYLNDKECYRLVNACSPELRAIVTAALLAGARYGEITRLKATDYNPDSGTLYIKISKSGKDRYIALTDEGREFFSRAVAGKKSTDIVFLRHNGQPWGRAHQYRPMKEACEAAKIDPVIGFHILRHTYGSRLAMKSVPMQVIATQLGHADTRITEKHYAHLGPSYVADTIRKAFDEIGLLEDDGKVVPIKGAR